MFRDYIKHLSETRFWISKWMVATVVLIAVLIAGIVFLMRQNIDFDTFLNYFALGLLVFVVITLFYGIIAIHDVPYEIAKKRDHPHQDAIHAAGWVSLFTLHVLWPFLWIWAMLYRPDRGWGFQQAATDAASLQPEQVGRFEELLRRVEALEAGSKDAEPRKRVEPVDKRAEALKSAAPAEPSAKRGSS